MKAPLYFREKKRKGAFFVNAVFFFKYWFPGASMSSTDWREQKREELFESTLKGLENHRRVDPGFTLDDARAALEHQYVLEGNDWLGRGELGDIVSSATIAAYEHFIFEWAAELKSAENKQER